MTRNAIETAGWALLLAAAPVQSVWSGEPAWQRVFADDFNRTALGTDWLILRGDWHLNDQGELQIQRQWPSHSHLMSTVPLRGKNVRVAFDLRIPADQAGRFGAHVQAGALGWGGGGIDDRAGVEFEGVPPDRLNAADAAGGADAVRILLDRTHRIGLTLVDGGFEVFVDGRSVRRGMVPQGRSLVNSSLQFSACPGGIVDNLTIDAAPLARPLPELNTATPEENRQATVFAEPFLDPAKPDGGIQEAIDRLPSGGGVVILPKGTFVLRRFLELGSHTTLVGQGPETVLRVIDVGGAAVESVSVTNGRCVLTLQGPHDFRPGDAFAYGAPGSQPFCWGHPGMPQVPGSTRLLVLAADGNRLTVSAPPMPDLAARGRLAIGHFFPIVCSFNSEYAEVKDLTLIGPDQASGASGRFMINPVTFGVTSHPRIHRLAIRNFPADGISAQVCDDGRFLDNTIAGVQQGLHPGTTTLRAIVARNHSVDNGVGLYFCWYNANGIYLRNRVKNFTGYPDAGDLFNTLAFNTLTTGMTITVGYNGCLFGNRLPELTVFGPVRNAKALASAVGPGGRSYEVAPRYFTIGGNRIGRLTLFQHIRGNVVAGNRGLSGDWPEVRYLEAAPDAGSDPFTYREEAGLPPDNRIVMRAGIPPLDGLPETIDRAGPALPPALPEPVLDGRDFYTPASPHAGFQDALDRLAKQGGTLRLPGGRYTLAQPLRVPANVTVIGYGTGTILLPGGASNSLLLVERVGGVTLRDFAIEGNWSGAAGRGAAVNAVGAEGLTLAGLDIRGWSGPALSASGGRQLTVQDCRVLRCPAAAYAIRDVAEARIETCSAVQGGGSGFEVEGGRGVRLVGNVAGLNQGAGYAIRSSGAWVMANNANNNLRDGIVVENAADVRLAGNTCAANNQAGETHAGIRLAGGARNARLLFNNCGDDQIRATQRVGIREDAGAGNNEIRFNCTATMATRRGFEKEPSLLILGTDSTASDNWTETILPSNDSLEGLERPAADGR